MSDCACKFRYHESMSLSYHKLKYKMQNSSFLALLQAIENGSKGIPTYNPSSVPHSYLLFQIHFFTLSRDFISLARLVQSLYKYLLVASPFIRASIHQLYLVTFNRVKIPIDNKEMKRPSA